jgi:hypothetical protein
VRTLIERVLATNANDVAAQATTATAAWELANERIAALRAAAPGQRVQPAPALPPVPRPAMPAPTPIAPPTAPSVDSGELVGEWTFCLYTGGIGIRDRLRQPDRESLALGEPNGGARAVVEMMVNLRRQEPPGSYNWRVSFTRSGNDYTGVLTPNSGLTFIGDPFGGSQGASYAPGATVFRLTRTGPETYEGRYLQTRDYFGRDWQPLWLRTKIIVKGKLMYQSGEESHIYINPRPGPHTLVWLRR